MSKRGVGVLIGVLVGAIIGGVVGHASGGGQVLLETAIVGVSGAVLGGVFVLGVWQHWTWLDVAGGLVEGLLDCCSTSAVLVVASVVTIAGFLLWHNLLLAALAGGSIIVMMLIGLSVVAASYKAGSQSS